MSIIEKEWEYNGLKCVVLVHEGLAHRCGYVGIKNDHPLYGVSYSEKTDVLNGFLSSGEEIGKRGIIPLMLDDGSLSSPDCAFDVHGGITYSGDDESYPCSNDGLWWFGYDCGHCDDAPIPEYDNGRESSFRNGVVRSLSYCIEECENLADQLQMVIKHLAKST